MEQRILMELDFRIFEEGICDFYVASLLKVVAALTNEHASGVLSKLCFDIQGLLCYCVHACPENIPTKCLNMLPAAVVQIAMIMGTHCVGRFPATVWMIHAFQLKEDELKNFVQLLMKVLFGREKIEELQI